MTNPKFVICIDNSDYPASLEVRKIYEVVPDEEANNLDQVRVLDESGEDYLYPASCFMEADLPKEIRAALS